MVLEGWCTGFQAISEDTLKRFYDTATLPNPNARISSISPGKDYLRGPFFLGHSLSSLLEVNSQLKPYEQLWKNMDCFIQVVPEDLSLTWRWRLEVSSAGCISIRKLIIKN